MRALAGGIILYAIIFSGISLWKYDVLRYNARDLAIYNQVTWQLSNKGSILRQAQDDNIVMPKTDKPINRITDKLYSSIQGHNYLGDHFEPILLLIAPLYALIPDPRTLLILQTLALALATWPLFLISQKVIESLSYREYESTENSKTQKLKNWTPTLVGVLWLLHPAVQNANLFEFHSLSFAPLFFFFLLYYYFKLIDSQTHKLKNYSFFTLFLLLSLFVREDVALITLLFGVIVFSEQLRQGLAIQKPSAAHMSMVPPKADHVGEAERSRALARLTRVFAIDNLRPLLMPFIVIVTSVTWFVLAQSVIAHFSPSHGYQFRIYYEWIPRLGSLGAIIKGVITHILSLQNLEMLIGLLLPLLFLPLLKPKWLLLTLPPLAAIILSSAGGGALIWQTHYGLLLLPGIFLALVVGISTLLCHSCPVSRYGAGSSGNPETNKKSTATWFFFWIPSTSVGDDSGKRAKDASLIVLALLTAAIGATLAFGPIVPAVQAITENEDTISHANELLASIPPHATVASTDRFLAPLSSRRDLILLPLMLLGVQQYAAAPYPPSAYPDYLVLDEADMRADIVQAYSIAWTQPYAAHMKARFRQLLDEGGYVLTQQEGMVALFVHSETEMPKKIPPFTFETEDFTNVRGGLELDRLGSVQLVIDADE